MKIPSIIAISSAIAALTAPLHAGVNTYQVTGPVLEATDAKIVIQKDTEKWEIARTADTKITGEIKVGAKVTIQYTMSANSIEVKPSKDAKPATTTAKPVKPAAAPTTPAKKP